MNNKSQWWDEYPHRRHPQDKDCHYWLDAYSKRLKEVEALPRTQQNLRTIAYIKARIVVLTKEILEDRGYQRGDAPHLNDRELEAQFCAELGVNGYVIKERYGWRG
jgi:hypothetical protein